MAFVSYSRFKLRILLLLLVSSVSYADGSNVSDDKALRWGSSSAEKVMHVDDRLRVCQGNSIGMDFYSSIQSAPSAFELDLTVETSSPTGKLTYSDDHQDTLRFQVVSQRSGRLALFNLDANCQLTLLYPAQQASDEQENEFTQLPADRIKRVPAETLPPIYVDAPAGRDQVLAIVYSGDDLQPAQALWELSQGRNTLSSLSVLQHHSPDETAWQTLSLDVRKLP